MTPDPTLSEREIIVGGDANHSDEEYTRRLGESISACVKLLKTGRWLSVVFQHWNIAYFHAILAAAAEHGAALRAAVSQIGDPIWSMHKKKGTDSVLAGELILTFFNTGRRVEYRTGRPFDLEAEVHGLITRATSPIFGEHLFNALILRAWDAGSIDSLNVSKVAFSGLLSDFGLSYDDKGHFWTKTDRRFGRLDLLSNSDAAE